MRSVASWLLLPLFSSLWWSTPALASPSDGAVTLWLTGNYREHRGEQQIWTALLGVTVAFDRLNAPPIEDATAAQLAEPPVPSSEPNASTTQGNQPSPDSPPAAAVDRGVEQLSAAFVQAAVRAALRAQRANEQEQRLDSLRARSRASAALPELRLGAGRSTDQSVRLSPTVEDPYRYTQAGGADLWLEARVSWKLDRLLFAREELTIERLRDTHYQARWKRAQAVVDALFAWQKALLEAQDPEHSLQQQLLAQLRAAHQAAVVDALTGGWFSEKYALWQEPATAPQPQR